MQKSLRRKLQYKSSVGQMLTKADEGGRGVQEPLILADVICEQTLKVHLKRVWMGHWGQAWATYVQCVSYTYQSSEAPTCSMLMLTETDAEC